MEISDIRDELESQLRELRGRTRGPDGLIPVQMNSSRNVYRINTDKYGMEHKGRLIKIAPSTSKENENRWETQVWKAARGTSAEKYLCPIRTVANDYSYIIMADGNVNTTVGEKIFESMNQTLEAELGRSSNVSKDNIGRYNGNVVLFDYPWKL